MIGQSRDGVEKWLRGTPNMTVFNGHGAFHRAAYDRASAARTAIASTNSAPTKSSSTPARAPVVPPLDGIERIPLLTNSNLLELTEVPRASGDRRRELYRARIRADVPALRQPRDRARARRARAHARGCGFRRVMQKVLAREGVEFRFGVQPTRVEPQPHRANEVMHRLRAERFPRSTRRICCSPPAARPIPTTSASTPRASRSTSTALIEVDGQLRTKVEGIWAIGDVNGRGAFTHTSYNDYRDRRGEPARRRRAQRRYADHDVCGVRRSAARARRHERERGARGRAARR